MAVFKSDSYVNMRNISFWIDLDQYSDSDPGLKETRNLTFTEEEYFADEYFSHTESFTGEFEYANDEFTWEVTNLTGTVTSYSYSYYEEWYGFDEFDEYVLFSDSRAYSISGFELDLNDFLNQAPLDILRNIFSEDDHITGSGVLLGLGGSDFIRGGATADVLDGGEGEDVMLGGSGDDIYYVENTRDAVWEYADEGVDRVQSSISYTLTANVENLTLAGSSAINGIGNELANTLIGNAAANSLNGRGGNDTMIGRGGNDTYVVEQSGDKVFEKAGEGIDVVNALISYKLTDNVENLILKTASDLNGTGNALDNILSGNSGKNTLNGGAGNDTLKGGGGNDTLIGGVGADKLYGGSGADIFQFQSYKHSDMLGRDTIYDFSRAQGDKIDLSIIDARSTVSGNQAFTFIGTNSFSNKAGELRAVTKNGDTFIYGDLNGDGGIDVSIKLDTAVNLVSSDFIL